MMDVATLERFEEKVIPEPMSGCWLWLAQISPQGYAYLKIAGRSARAHRVAYEHFVGPIPTGLVLDHLCRNRGCVNPAHLEPVTVGENTRRGNARLVWLARTHCKNGHAFDVANLGRRADGSRRCLACHRKEERARWLRKKELLG